MRDQGIGSWPRRRARMTPDRIALVHEGTTTSYAELDRAVAGVATGLEQLGVRKSDRIAYLGPNHPALLETLFASAALGAIFVPLNTRLAADELLYQLRDSGARTLVHDAALSTQVAEIVEDLNIATIEVGGESSAFAMMRHTDADLPDLPVAHSDVAMIMYTSGTTGRPKGVMLTHGNVTWNCINLMVDLDLGRDVALVNAPLFHAAALNHTALPVLLKGGACVIVSKFDAAETLSAIEEHQVTLVFGVPTMFEQIAAAPGWADADLSSLRLLHCGGSPVPEALIRLYQQRGLTFVQGYGMTEASPGVMVLRPEDTERKIGSAGRTHFFSDVVVARPDGSIADVDEPGELLVAGPNVMAGYWNLPDATAQTLAGDWLHTGDIAVIDKDGYTFIVDRIKDMIISGGENIYPAEVELALRQLPGVREVVVVGVPDPQWGEVGCAVVVPDPTSVTDAAGLLAALEHRLARYKIPREVVFVSDLPRNASGKLLRREVRTSVLDLHDPEPPTSTGTHR